MNATFNIVWIDRKREPQCDPDPKYPKGIDIDLSKGGPHCASALNYPSRRCGYYYISCRRCGANALITTAGRPDDPRSVKIACKLN